MIKRLLWIAALISLSAGALCAQDISGDWQGTLLAVQGPLRTVLKISKSDDGGWNALIFSIDQGTDQGGIRVTSITLEGSILKYSIDRFNGSYEGKLSADGTSIAGTWTQNNGPRQLNFQRPTKATAWTVDSSIHSVQFITVEAGVKLEVLDWGGSGRPLVLLAGLGNTAHIFDSFVDKLTANYHVYGITRRGFGASSSPKPASGNYLADRLGDDVLAVMAALKLSRPVLVGHSIAGEELSSVGARHPEKVAGLVYLDAGFPYAYYDSSQGDLLLDTIDLRRKLDLMMPGAEQPPDFAAFLQELLQTSLPRFEKDLQDQQAALQLTPPEPPGPSVPPKPPSVLDPGIAIIAGEQEYTEIKCPVLAIFAVPHYLGPAFKDNPAVRAALEADDLARMTAISKSFEAGIPSARVVRLPNASHYVFLSNEPDVLREMNAFLASLP
jgi:pimeloyl-ACP methyl ester carboxylesterase